MSSNIRISRICDYCGNEFVARTTVTKTCGHRCASALHKARKRGEQIERSNKETVQTISSKIIEVQNRDYLSIQDTCNLLGVSRWTVSRAIKDKRLKAVNLGKRIVIKRTEIDHLFSI
jgi:excisionase family DNA binding protein